MIYRSLRILIRKQTFMRVGKRFGTRINRLQREGIVCMFIGQFQNAIKRITHITRIPHITSHGIASHLVIFIILITSHHISSHHIIRRHFHHSDHSDHITSHLISSHRISSHLRSPEQTRSLRCSSLSKRLVGVRSSWS